MDNLSIEPTDSTPLLKYYPDGNLLLFKGLSYPENPVEFYKPVMKWIEDFLLSLTNSLTVRCTLEYLNTSSIRIFINIFQTIEKFYNSGKKITVEWIYDPENEMALEYGNFFSERLEMPFTIIKEDKEAKLS